MFELNIGTVTQCLLLLLASVVVYLWHSSRRLVILGSRLPGPPSLPLLGNILDFINNDFDVCKTVYQIASKFNGFARLWIGNSLLVLITDPDDLQTFYTKTTMLDRADQYHNIRDVMINSIFVANGERWKKMRKMFMLTFSPTPVEIFKKNFLIAQNAIVEELGKNADGVAFKAKKTIVKVMVRATMASAADVDVSDEKIEWAEERAHYMTEMCYLRQFVPLYRFNFTFNMTSDGKKYKRYIAESQDWVTELLNKKKADLADLIKKGEPIPSIFIYNMLQKYKDEPMDSLRDELLTLLITGNETTSGVIGFALTILGLCPDVQEKVYLEDQKIQNYTEGKEFDLEYLQDYEYLDRVIKETLRIFPIGPIIARKLGEDTYFGKHLVPKGANVAAAAIYTYRNPNLFPDPFKFDPDRFLPENVKQRHPYAFNPFSAGPRGCPGQQYGNIAMKMLLSAVVRNFKITSQYKNIEEALENVRSEVTLTDKRDYPISIERRTKCAI